MTVEPNPVEDVDKPDVAGGDAGPTIVGADVEGTEQAEQPEGPRHVAVDPLQLASELVVEALTAMRTTGGNDRRVGQTIALAQAAATVALAAATRQQFALNDHMAGVALEDRQNAIDAAVQRVSGPAGIVVPQVRLGNGRG